MKAYLCAILRGLPDDELLALVGPELIARVLRQLGAAESSAESAAPPLEPAPKRLRRRVAARAVAVDVAEPELPTAVVALAVAAVEEEPAAPAEDFQLPTGEDGPAAVGQAECGDTKEPPPSVDPGEGVAASAPAETPGEDHAPGSRGAADLDVGLRERSPFVIALDSETGLFERVPLTAEEGDRLARLVDEDRPEVLAEPSNTGGKGANRTDDEGPNPLPKTPARTSPPDGNPGPSSGGAAEGAARPLPPLKQRAAELDLLVALIADEKEPIGARALRERSGIRVGLEGLLTQLVKAGRVSVSGRTSAARYSIPAPPKPLPPMGPTTNEMRAVMGMNAIPVLLAGPGQRDTECRHYKGCLDRFVRSRAGQSAPHAHCPPACPSRERAPHDPQIAAASRGRADF